MATIGKFQKDILDRFDLRHLDSTVVYLDTEDRWTAYGRLDRSVRCTYVKSAQTLGSMGDRVPLVPIPLTFTDEWQGDGLLQCCARRWVEENLDRDAEWLWKITYDNGDEYAVMLHLVPDDMVETIDDMFATAADYFLGENNYSEVEQEMLQENIEGWLYDDVVRAAPEDSEEEELWEALPSRDAYALIGEAIYALPYGYSFDDCGGLELGFDGLTAVYQHATAALKKRAVPA